MHGESELFVIVVVMDKLKEEIKRKKEEAQLLKLKQQQEQAIESEESTEVKRLSFIRQKDRISWQQEQLERKQQEIEEERTAKRQKVEIESNNIINKASVSSLSVKVAETSLQVDEKLQRYRQMATRDIQQKLRSLRQPITLFGEDRQQRIDRLIDFLSKHPMASEEVAEDEYLLRDKKREALAIAREEAEYDHEDERGHDRDDAASDGVGDSENDVSESDEKEKKEKKKRDREDRDKALRYDPTVLYHRMSDLSPQKIIYKFFRSLVKQWEQDLRQRPEAEKASMKGRLELKAQKQCKDHIRPLFKLCQQKTIPEDIQHKLVLMVTYCEEGNFVKANDEYIKTAIGNSAWPIGLTMVGIHERSGRERISTSKVMTSLLFV